MEITIEEWRSLWFLPEASHQQIIENVAKYLESDDENDFVDAVDFLFHYCPKKQFQKYFAQVSERILANDDPKMEWVAVCCYQPEIKAVETVFNRGHYMVLFRRGQNAMEYLLSHGLKDWVFKQCRKQNLIPPTTRETDEILFEAGLEDILYSANHCQVLLEHKCYDVFVKNHSYNATFLKTCPELVDWEYLWEHSTDEWQRKELLDAAKANPSSFRCRAFLNNRVDRSLSLWGRLKKIF